mmetsp:Transcript_12335/g.31298  ORF Transcript_12335/g.31298 Transcript_12335/m.31298 type:complete len:237 (+) Transcript_12335:95-805(+)
MMDSTCLRCSAMVRLVACSAALSTHTMESTSMSVTASECHSSCTSRRSSSTRMVTQPATWRTGSAAGVAAPATASACGCVRSTVYMDCRRSRSTAALPLQNTCSFCEMSARVSCVYAFKSAGAMMLYLKSFCTMTPLRGAPAVFFLPSATFLSLPSSAPSPLACVGSLAARLPTIFACFSPLKVNCTRCALMGVRICVCGNLGRSESRRRLISLESPCTRMTWGGRSVPMKSEVWA